KMRYEDKGNFAYLACDNAKRSMGCPIRDGWRYDSFEEAFIQFIDELDVPSIINSEHHESERFKLQNDIEATKGKIILLEQDWNETYELRKETKTSRDKLAQKLDAEKRNTTNSMLPKLRNTAFPKIYQPAQETKAHHNR